MHPKLTPEDEAHVLSTYRSYLQHMAWLVLSIITGLGLLALAHLALELTPTSPASWILGIYGAAIPTVLSNGGCKVVLNFVMGPVVLFHELSRRLRSVAEGRRSLKARFGQA